MAELANRVRAKDPEGFKDWTDDELELAFLRKARDDKDEALDQYKGLAGEKSRISFNNEALKRLPPKSAEEIAGAHPIVRGYANLPGNIASLAGGLVQDAAGMVAKQFSAGRSLMRKTDLSEELAALEETKKNPNYMTLGEAANLARTGIMPPSVEERKRRVRELEQEAGIEKGTRTLLDEMIATPIGGEGTEAGRKLATPLALAGFAAVHPLGTLGAVAGGEAGRYLGEKSEPYVRQVLGDRAAGTEAELRGELGETGMLGGMTAGGAVGGRVSRALGDPSLIDIAALTAGGRGLRASETPPRITTPEEALAAEAKFNAEAQQKPAATAGGAKDPAAVAVPEGYTSVPESQIDAVLSQVARDNPQAQGVVGAIRNYASQHGWRMAGEFVGSTAAGLVAKSFGLNYVPGLGWVVRRMGGVIGRVAGNAADKARAAAEAKPVAAAGAGDTSAVPGVRRSTTQPTMTIPMTPGGVVDLAGIYTGTPTRRVAVGVPPEPTTTVVAPRTSTAGLTGGVVEAPPVEPVVPRRTSTTLQAVEPPLANLAPPGGFPVTPEVRPVELPPVERFPVETGEPIPGRQIDTAALRPEVAPETAPAAPAAPAPANALVALAQQHPLIQAFRENAELAKDWLMANGGKLTPTERAFLETAEPGLKTLPQWQQRVIPAKRAPVPAPEIEPPVVPRVPAAESPAPISDPIAERARAMNLTEAEKQWILGEFEKRPEGADPDATISAILDRVEEIRPATVRAGEAPGVAPEAPAATPEVAPGLQGPAGEALAAEAAGTARPGAQDAAAARLEALNALDTLESMVRPQIAPERPAVPEPRRPAAVEPSIPDELARQQALREKAEAAQAAREAEPGYAESKAAKQAHPAYVETYDKMIADGFDKKTARAAAYKAAERSMAAEKARAEAERLEQDLEASVEEPDLVAIAKAEAERRPVEPAKNQAEVDAAHERMLAEEQGKDTVQFGVYKGKKIGDTIEGGAVITEIQDGRISEVAKPKKKITGETGGDVIEAGETGGSIPASVKGAGVSGGIARIENFDSLEAWWNHHKALGFSNEELMTAIKVRGRVETAEAAGPIAESFAKAKEETPKYKTAGGSPFRFDQPTKERIRLQQRAREGVANVEAARRERVGGESVPAEAPGPERVVPEADRGRDLEGLPNKVKVNGVEKVFGALRRVQESAQRYVESLGRKYNPPRKYAQVDVERAKRIADEYEKMLDRNDPKATPEYVKEVDAAYQAMIDETLAQYEQMLKDGVKVEFMEPGKDPYPNPRMAIEDVVKNNHLWVYPTETGFGSNLAFDASRNPLLAPTKHKISGRTATANDIFRAVHDYYGHIKDGVGFRAAGEENAWRSHSGMYSALARRAMTTETRGQNSWLNYGPHGAKNRTAKTADTVFADQKTGLLPEWVMNEGARDAAAPGPGAVARERVGNMLKAGFDKVKGKLARLLDEPGIADLEVVLDTEAPYGRYGGKRALAVGEKRTDTITIDPAQIAEKLDGTPKQFVDWVANVVFEHEPSHARGLHTLSEKSREGLPEFPEGAFERTRAARDIRQAISPEENRFVVGEEIAKQNPEVQAVVKQFKDNLLRELTKDDSKMWNDLKAEGKTLREIRETAEAEGGAGGDIPPQPKGTVDTVYIRNRPPAQRNSKSVDQVQKVLKNPDISNLPREEQIKLMADQGVREVLNQQQQIRSGEKWYKLDIEAMENALRKAEPSLENPANMDMFKLISASTSFGNKPNPNIEMALQIYRAMQKDGVLPAVQTSGKQWAGNPTFSVTKAKLDAMMKDFGGPEGMIKWLLEDHTVAETRKYNKWVPGRWTDTVKGSEVLGPKGSAFFQNLMGNYSRTTADMWYSRSFNRWRGTEFFDSPRNTSEFKLMQEVNEEIARRLNLDPADTQAMLWFHEKALYGRLGAKEDFGSYAVAGRRAAESLKLRQNLGISELTASSPLKPSERSIAFEVRFGDNSPYSQKYNWSSLTPEQAKQVTYEHGKHLIEAIEAETGARVTRADPSTGVDVGVASPNWIVKMKGTPEQLEAATNLFGLGSQQNAAIGSRVSSSGSVGLEASAKPRPESKQGSLFGGHKGMADWNDPGFIKRVWDEYAKAAPELAKDGGASLDYSDGGIRIRLYGDAIEANPKAAAAALKKAIETVDPSSSASVSPKKFDTYWTSNKWSEAKAGESYRQALKDRGYTDAEIDQFVKGADKSVDAAWKRAQERTAPPSRRQMSEMRRRAAGRVSRGETGGDIPQPPRSSIASVLENLQNVKKPRRRVKGVLEGMVDLKPRIAKPEANKAPLAGMIKGR